MITKVSRKERLGERLMLVGTVHVDPKSVSMVEQVIMDLRPSIVALELDQPRLMALSEQKYGRKASQGEKGREVKWSGVSVLLIALVERLAGRLTGSAPGREMLAAVETAEKVGARVALVDLPIGQTVGLLRGLPFKEKARLGIDLLAGLVVLPFGKGQIEELGDGVEDQIKLFRERYPSLSRMLIDVREEYMVDAISRVLEGSEGQVVAVVGLGHMGSLARALTAKVEMIEARRKAGYSSSASWTVNT